MSNPQPTLLSASIPDIAAFYKIFNNFPWTALPMRDGVHFFRAGVQPLWEDPENFDGGCWTLKVRKDATVAAVSPPLPEGETLQQQQQQQEQQQGEGEARPGYAAAGAGAGLAAMTTSKALRTWEELCLMVLGGELQSVVARGTCLTSVAVERGT